MPAADTRAEWWSLAACLTADPELFFPISLSGPALRQVARAKAICARCEVKQACLGYALDAGPSRGYGAGLPRKSGGCSGRATEGHVPVCPRSRRLARPVKPAAVP